MTGTLITVGAVLAGTAIGVGLGARFPAGIRQRVLAGLGLVTAVISVDLALAWRDTSALYVLGATSSQLGRSQTFHPEPGRRSTVSPGFGRTFMVDAQRAVPFADTRSRRKPGARTSLIGFSGEVCST